MQDEYFAVMRTKRRRRVAGLLLLQYRCTASIQIDFLLCLCTSYLKQYISTIKGFKFLLEFISDESFRLGISIFAVEGRHAWVAGHKILTAKLSSKSPSRFFHKKVKYNFSFSGRRACTCYLPNSL